MCLQMQELKSSNSLFLFKEDKILKNLNNIRLNELAHIQNDKLICVINLLG